MIATFLLIMPKATNEDDTKKIKDFIARIARLDFPMSQVEILIVCKDSPNNAVKKIPGRPFVKIISVAGGEGLAIREAFKNSYGDIIITSEIDDKPHSACLKDLEKIREITVQGANFFVDGLIFRCKDIAAVPEDLKSFKTWALMKCLAEGLPVMGHWGQLNRREILRFAYIWERIRPLKWAKLFLKFICSPAKV